MKGSSSDVVCVGESGAADADVAALGVLGTRWGDSSGLEVRAEGSAPATATHTWTTIII